MYDSTYITCLKVQGYDMMIEEKAYKFLISFPKKKLISYYILLLQRNIFFFLYGTVKMERII